MPFVRAGLIGADGKEAIGIFLLDSGMLGAALSLNEAFQEAHPDLLTFYPAITPAAASAVNGRFEYRLTRVPKLKLGPYSFNDPITVLPAHLAGIHADPTMAGLIGADILSRFTVTFDYPQRKLFLKPNERITEPFETDMSGLRLTARPPLFSPDTLTFDVSLMYAQP